jgi:hypothetical protein
VDVRDLPLINRRLHVTFIVAAVEVLRVPKVAQIAVLFCRIDRTTGLIVEIGIKIAAHRWILRRESPGFSPGSGGTTIVVAGGATTGTEVDTGKGLAGTIGPPRTTGGFMITGVGTTTATGIEAIASRPA